MKKLKKIIAVFLCFAMLVPLGCNDKSANEQATISNGEQVIKPSTITVMWDNTMVTEDNGGIEFARALGEALGINVEIIRPEYNSYYEVLEASFVSDEAPDVFVLAANKYTYYASIGALWNMEDAWNNSSLKQSGRMEQWAIDKINHLKTTGKNGVEGIYGFNLVRGNGCVTYVRTEWLEECGYKADGSDIKTFEDYYNMCEAFKDKYNVAPITVAKLLNGEAPYTNYLPEFYQDAYPDFYKDTSGKWVDGFSEQAMKDALKRLQQANQRGLIDTGNYTSSTMNIRTSFYNGYNGVFTYWAGTWAQTIVDKLVENGQDDARITALKPIEEVGKYYERPSAVIAINSRCENPEGVFKYFIEPIYDGDKVQSLWTYGVKGIHWDDKAETITLKDKKYTYESGEFHFLLNPATKSKFVSENYISPLLSMADFMEGKDPALTSKTPLVSQSAKEVMNMFNENSINTPLSITTYEIEEYNSRIWEARNKTIMEVVWNGKDIEEAMEEYNASVGEVVKLCLESLKGK